MAPSVEVSRKKIRRDVEEELRMTGAHTDEATTSAIVEKQLREELRKSVQNEVGARVTPAFPKLIYTPEEDNITENGE